MNGRAGVRKPSFPVPQSFEASVDKDQHQRIQCTHCGFIEYRNPKVVVGSVVRKEKKVLLCKRAIDPGKGLWTIPAGYLEVGETAEQGAIREAREEANAKIALHGLLSVYSVHQQSQILLIYRADLVGSDCSAGSESSDVRLFSWENIPWSSIAFPSVKWALRHDNSVQDAIHTFPFSNPVED